VRQRPRYRKFTDTVFKIENSPARFWPRVLEKGINQTCTTRSPIIGQVRCP
jgi:hypothetical protein